MSSNPSCILSGFGTASVDLDDGYHVEVGLPAVADAWGRGGVQLSYGDPMDCHYSLGTTGARVQIASTAIDEPGCPGCGTFKAVYVEGISLPAVHACNSCDDTDCRDFGSTHADQWYLWCDDFLESF